MKTLYQYDHNSLVYEPVKSTNSSRFHLLFVISSMFLMLGYFLGNQKESMKFSSVSNKTPGFAIGSEIWKDSVFNDYETRASIYLEEFPNTPIKADMLRLAAYNAYDSTGIILPVELALAQAQLESSMGTRGRSPKNNPFNVGEWDSKTVKWMESTYDGIEAYYFLMCKDYLRCKDLNILFKNFTNCKGHRYASNPLYEDDIKNQFIYIKKVIDKKMKLQTDNKEV